MSCSMKGARLNVLCDVRRLPIARLKVGNYRHALFVGHKHIAIAECNYK